MLISYVSITEINSLWFGVHVLAAAQASSDRCHHYSGKGAGRSSAGRGARPPMDPNRGGAQSKVSMLINAHRTSGWGRELWELAEQMMQSLDERRDAIEPGSWADKLFQLCHAILEDESEERFRELAERYMGADSLRQAVTNRYWQSWRRGGYER